MIKYAITAAILLIASHTVYLEKVPRAKEGVQAVQQCLLIGRNLLNRRTCMAAVESYVHLLETEKLPEFRAIHATVPKEGYLISRGEHLHYTHGDRMTECERGRSIYEKMGFMSGCTQLEHFRHQASYCVELAELLIDEFRTKVLPKFDECWACW